MKISWVEQKHDRMCYLVLTKESFIVYWMLYSKVIVVVLRLLQIFMYSMHGGMPDSEINRSQVNK